MPHPVNDISPTRGQAELIDLARMTGDDRTDEAAWMRIREIVGTTMSDAELAGAVANLVLAIDTHEAVWWERPGWPSHFLDKPGITAVEAEARASADLAHCVAVLLYPDTTRRAAA